ncbi:MAG: glutathione S-transferase N-terminal domain-containing protein [Nitrospirota bacterium]|nr:glutathione S-transferase N-terminal domain-containing protein [Nitrospirota bacterium]
MNEQVIIYGKDRCPYTMRARMEHDRKNVSYHYINVEADPQGLAEMLKLTGGKREVPVIVTEGRTDFVVGCGGV